MKKQALVVTMADGSRWAVPLEVIARNRAEHYADDEFGGDVERSLAEDTIPFFEGDEGGGKVTDWAENNMDWADVEKYAVQLPSEPMDPEFQGSWVNGKKEFEMVKFPDEEEGPRLRGAGTTP